jgi:hypothetical protein
MPPFVLEVASESTWKKDVRQKVTQYEAAGVQEYLVFDPTGAYLRDPPLRGWHMRDGVWKPWPPVRRIDGALVWESAVLGLAARPEGVLLRFDHPVQGPLPIRADWRTMHRRAAERAEAAEAAQRAAEEQSRRQEAELAAAQAEIARLRARLEEQH